MKLCVICKKHPATVPDRSLGGRPIKRLCRSCHTDRLCGDLERILRGR
jgi:hypothetical protein